MLGLIHPPPTLITFLKLHSPSIQNIPAEHWVYCGMLLLVGALLFGTAMLKSAIALQCKSLKVVQFRIKANTSNLKSDKEAPGMQAVADFSLTARNLNILSVFD